MGLSDGPAAVLSRIVSHSYNAQIDPAAPSDLTIGRIRRSRKCAPEAPCTSGGSLTRPHLRISALSYRNPVDQAGPGLRRNLRCALLPGDPAHARHRSAHSYECDGWDALRSVARRAMALTGVGRCAGAVAPDRWNALRRQLQRSGRPRRLVVDLRPGGIGRLLIKARYAAKRDPISALRYE